MGNKDDATKQPERSEEPEHRNPNDGDGANGGCGNPSKGHKNKSNAFMLVMAVYGGTICRTLLLLLGAFGIGLFAWWSSKLCGTAFSLWGAASPAFGTVVVCFWLFCVTVLISVLVIAAVRAVRDSEWDSGEYNEAMDRLVVLQATVKRLSDEISKGSNGSNQAGK